nr:hypothetical protein [Bacteroidota bacterium]
MLLAFVTYWKLPNLTDDDRLIQQYLQERGFEVRPTLWDDPNVDWEAFDALVLRSMWDYFERPDEFNIWLDKMESLHCLVLNPISIVRWNQNKNYFDEFARKGILLPPYVIIPGNDNQQLEKILADHQWQKAVVKPAISGGAYNTWVTTKDSAADDETRFAELLKSGDVIVQIFVEEIITKGELSLIYFNKKFSHAILKRAKEGDFRIQTQFGGTAEIFQPTHSILRQATDLLNGVEESLLYARVDGVVTDDGRFLLMELE